MSDEKEVELGGRRYYFNKRGAQFTRRWSRNALYSSAARSGKTIDGFGLERAVVFFLTDPSSDFVIKHEKPVLDILSKRQRHWYSRFWSSRVILVRSELPIISEPLYTVFVGAYLDSKGLPEVCVVAVPTSKGKAIGRTEWDELVWRDMRKEFYLKAIALSW